MKLVKFTTWSGSGWADNDIYLNTDQILSVRQSVEQGMLCVEMVGRTLPELVRLSMEEMTKILSPEDPELEPHRTITRLRIYRKSHPTASMLECADALRLRMVDVHPWWKETTP
jgi:hypothetical protein